MGKIVELNAHRPGWVYDEITGIWYDPSLYAEWTPEFWVVYKTPYNAQIETAIACFTSEAKANEYRLKNGIVATTKIVDFS